MTLEDKIEQWETIKAESEPGDLSWTYANGVLDGLFIAGQIVGDNGTVAKNATVGDAQPTKKNGELLAE